MISLLRTFMTALVAAFVLIPPALGLYGWFTGEAEFFVVVRAFYTYLWRITLAAAFGVAILALIFRSGWMLANHLRMRAASNSRSSSGANGK